MESLPAVFNISKVRFWKQITTNGSRIELTDALYSIYQRYDFESKSQQIPLTPILRESCIQYIKGTILKANHNLRASMRAAGEAVFNISKVRFWKQITTPFIRNSRGLGLYSIYQRYDFESKSQHIPFSLLKIENSFSLKLK